MVDPKVDKANADWLRAYAAGNHEALNDASERLSDLGMEPGCITRRAVNRVMGLVCGLPPRLKTELKSELDAMSVQDWARLKEVIESHCERTKQKLMEQMMKELKLVED